MAAPSTFLDAMHYRRSIYQLNNTSPISDDQIVSIANSVIQDVPSSFNSQSTRLVVLLHDEHVQFWNIVLECLRAIVPEGAFLKTEKRIAGFRNSYGTVCLNFFLILLFPCVRPPLPSMGQARS